MKMCIRDRDLTWFIISGILIGIGQNGISPVLMTISMRTVPAERKAAANSTNYLGMDKMCIRDRYEFDGLGKVPVTESTAGNIIAMSGIGDVTIGDTICAPDAVEPIEFVKISAPTIEMTFSVNDSPFAGREGKFVTSRQLRERLIRETMKDVSLRVTETDSTDAFNVAGRGEMSLSILIETMRREGYELSLIHISIPPCAPGAPRWSRPSICDRVLLSF